MTAEMKVEIDDRIRANPELLRAVTDATEYLRGLPVQTDPPANVRWWQPAKITNYVVLEIDDGHQAGRVKHCVFDSSLRTKADGESAVRWAWIDLLEHRSRVAHARLAATIADIEAEGLDAQ